MNTYTFHVSGTHCASCKILIEDVLGDEPVVKKVAIDLKRETVQIETESAETPENFAALLTQKIKPHGYTLSLGKINPDRGLASIWQALPIGLAFLALFFLLQKSGILNIGLGGKVTPLTSFLVGLVASVSSCLAVVGGLVLSLSAKVSEDSVSDKKNFILFHVGRLVSFAVLGGMLGVLGQAIGINFTFTAILGIVASLVMLVLGFHLTGVFRKNYITMPLGIFNFFRKVEHKTLTPLVLGFATFFLPCGFTQSMQVVALSSGAFASGALIMFAFALGTFPMLAFLSFGSASFAHSKHAPLFFKTSGVVVIGLGIFSFVALLAGLGVINPIFNI